MPLSPSDLTQNSRYARHLILPQIGAEGQKKIGAASVLIIGVGGLGSPASLYLTAAGIGRLGIIDPDEVSLSNLQRQILYSTQDVGKPKIFTAEQVLHALNPEIQIEAHPERLTARNALSLLGDYQYIVDGTDNFEARYLVNDACLELEKSWVYGAVSGFDAQVGWFSPGLACYRCLYPENPDQGLILNCDRNGVLGVVPGLAGMIQATEVLKSIIGLGESLSGKILSIDTLRMSFDSFSVPKRKECRCGTGASFALLENSETRTLSLNELENKKDAFLLDVRSRAEFNSGHISGARHVELGDLEEFAEKLEAEPDLSRGDGASTRPAIIVYCQGKARSSRAYQILKGQGIENVFQLILPDDQPLHSIRFL